MYPKILTFLVSVLLFSSLLIGFASASSGDGISSYSTPTPTPTATTDTNTTEPTPAPTPAPTPIYVYVDGNYVESLTPLHLSSYNRTVLSLTFAACVSCSVNGSTPNHWSSNQDSSGTITVFPDQIGSYEFRFQVLYDQIVNQVITLTVYGGGNNEPDVLPLNSTNRGFTLDVFLTVNELPHYPDPSEIAQANDNLNRQLYNEMKTDYQSQLSLSQSLSYVAIVVAVVVAVLIILILRQQRHHDAIVNNLNARGYGRGRE